MAEHDDVADDMEALHMADDVSIRASTMDNMMKIRQEGKTMSGQHLGTKSGKLWLQGRVYGWAEYTAVLEGHFLKFYATPEDVALSNPAQAINVAGCQCALTASVKYGRDFAFEVVIANPRSVVPVAAETAADAESWVKLLNTIKAVEEVREGYAGNLSAQHQAALAELRKKCGAEFEASSDAELLRFLRGTSWEVAKAHAYMVENKLWRKQFNVDALSINNVTREIRTGKLRLLSSKDKLGRPIIVGQPGKHNPKESSPLEVCKLLTYNMEQAIKSMSGDVESVILIIDFKGLSPRAVDMRVPRLVFETLQQRYPERIALLLLGNAPWFFRFIWATVRTFLNPSFLQKVHILGSDMTTLQAFVPPECLLQEHGGTVVWDTEEFIQKRAKEEGVAVSDGIGMASALEGGIDQSLLATLRDLPASEAIQGAVKTGYLTKLGGIVKNWKKRFFVLSESGLLYYYKDEKSAAPQGVILLERSTTGDNADKAHAFEIVTPLRTYIVCAADDAERTAWKAAVTKVCASQ